jgi:hypothetical protein
MKFSDFLAARGITEDLTDLQLEEKFKVKMFGVSFSRYLKSPDVTEADFRSAYNFIFQVDALEKLILPGQSYSRFITNQAAIRRFDVLSVSRPASPSASSKSSRPATPTPGGSRPTTPTPDEPKTERKPPGMETGETLHPEAEPPFKFPHHPEGKPTPNPEDQRVYAAWSSTNQSYFWRKLLAETFPELFTMSEFTGEYPNGMTYTLAKQAVSLLRIRILAEKEPLDYYRRDSAGRASESDDPGLLRSIRAYVLGVRKWIEGTLPEVSQAIDGFSSHYTGLQSYIAEAKRRGIRYA